MIRQLPPLTYQRIKRVSPSQFYSMKTCPYRMVLATASGNIALLPPAPAASFGTVLHKMMEGITKGTIRTDIEFDECFGNYIFAEEKKLQEQGFGYLVPLKNRIKDFGLKKAHIRNGLRTTNTRVSTPEKVSFDSEKWLASKDNTIGGRVDLIIRNEEGVEIIDLKTGSVTEVSDAGDVKQAYQIQLKLYAQLYFEEYGAYPDKLSLQTLNRDKYHVAFTSEECRSIYDEAKELLNKTNESIVTGNFIANPSGENCKHCMSRPACSFYKAYIFENQETNDVIGTVERIEQAGNGKASIWLRSSEHLFHITSFGREFYQPLQACIGKPVSVYNLWKEKQLLKYKAVDTTTVYE